MAVGLNSIGDSTGDFAGDQRATHRRRRRIAVIAGGVLLVHGWLAQQVASGLIDFSADQDRLMPARIEVAYVHQMALSAPPPSAAPAAPPAPVAAPRVRAPQPAKAASSAQKSRAKTVVARSEPLKAAELPESAASPAPAPTIEAAESAADVKPAPLVAAASAAASAPATAASASVVMAAASPASSAASAAAAFEWPSSTRMSYVLTGNYRGPVHGSAQVEWIRAGSRYQVHLDLLVGPSFAPIITRQMTSDGEITAAGLMPHRYDQQTKVVLRDPQHVTIAFEPGGIVLANGDRRPNSPGMQDTASQFVQLTYLFSTRPEMLRIGGTVDIPLALPQKIDVWTYDVVDQEALYTDLGLLPTIHLKPRRTGPPKPNELSAEIWFAPQLHYLPVRIRIQQDTETYLDLLIAKPPEIAAS